MAAFVICNASLRMTGQSWKECRDSIDSRATAARNLSPPRAAIDVVVLARAAYEMKRALRQNGAAPCKPWPVVKQTPHVPKGTLISSSPAVLAAAKQLPLRWGAVVLIYFRLLPVLHISCLNYGVGVWVFMTRDPFQVRKYGCSVPQSDGRVVCTDERTKASDASFKAHVQG